MLKYMRREGGDIVRVRIERMLDGEEEIVIRSGYLSERTEALKTMIEKLVDSTSKSDMSLYSSGAEYFIPFAEILYFDSGDGKVYAHTARGIYSSELRLFELEEMLPLSFIRVSKSTIVNVDLIVSLRKEAVGNGEIYFKNSEKMTYFSRSYYKALRNKIQKMRLG